MTASRALPVLVLCAVVGLRNSSTPRAAVPDEIEPVYGGKFLGDWIRQLQQADAAGRREAAFALANLGADAGPAVPALSNALNDKSDMVRAAAAFALGEIGPRAEKAVPALVEMLGDEQGQARFAAVRALERIGPAAVAALVEALGNRRPQVRGKAARVLAAYGAKARVAVPALLGGLKDAEPHVRRQVAHALARVDAQAAAPAVPLLVEMLKDDNRRARSESTNDLQAVGPKATSAVPALCERLLDQDAEVRAGAARALGAIGVEAAVAVPGLTDLLKDKQVDWQAADTLARFGDRAMGARSALEEISRDRRRSSLARAHAAYALWRIDKKTVVPVRVFRTVLNDPDVQVRRLAIAGLTEVGPEAAEAIPWLDDLLNDKDPAIREAAALALTHIGPQDREVDTVADAIAKKDFAAARSQAARMATNAEVESVMALFKLRAKKGFGVGDKRKAITPDGIEAKIMALAKKPLNKADVEAQAMALEQAAYRTAAIGVIARAKTPGKDVKEWKGWAHDLEKNALKLAEAARAMNAAEIKAAATRLEGTCNACHEKFR